jgi:hypothetical protein
MPAPAQSYLTTVEKKTGLTPRQILAELDAAGLGAADTPAGNIVAWLKEHHGLGHGHAMTLAQVSRHRATIDLALPETTPPPGSIGRLWLDGVASLPS